MFDRRFKRLGWVLSLGILTALLAIPTSASAARDLFFEETANAFWAVPYECADGSVVEGTLLVESTRDFESPDTEDDDPTARVQFLAVCPDSTSFSWGAVLPATIVSAPHLKRVVASASGIARDIFGVEHEVSFHVRWRAVAPKVVTINGPGSKRVEREARAIGQVTFDGELLVDGPNNHPTRPAPFIRIDTER